MKLKKKNLPLIIYLVTTQASEFVLCNCNEFFSLTYKQIQKTTIFIPKNMNNLEKKTVKKNVALEKEGLLKLKLKILQ